MALFSTLAFAKEWTVMMYFSGDNNLSQVLKIQMEAISKIATTDQVNLILQFDGNTLNDSLRIEVGTEVKIIENNLEYDMGSEQTLADFVQWSRINYPANKFALIVNGHGRGIINLPLKDGGGSALSMASSPNSTSNTVINEEAMVEKLEQVLDGDKIDLFIYSACLMGNLETLMTLSPIAKNVLASEYLIYLESDYKQSTVIGEGISLKSMIKTLNSNPLLSSQQLGQKLLAQYKTSYQTFKVFDLPGMFHYEEATLALYDLNHINRITYQMTNIIDEIQDEISNGHYDLDQLYLKVLSAPKVNLLGYIDLGILLHIFDDIHSTENTRNLIYLLYNNNQFIVDKTILHLPQKILGISVFFPTEKPIHNLSTFEYLLESYSYFQFNQTLPIYELIKTYLSYVDANCIKIIEEIILEIISNQNPSDLNEHLLYLKMEVYLQRQPRRVVYNYYRKITKSDYSGYYFKKHLTYIEKLLN